MLNFKGIFFENEHQKYTCPKTGAHFEPNDLSRRLAVIKQERDKIEKIVYQSKGIEKSQKEITLQQNANNNNH